MTFRDLRRTLNTLFDAFLKLTILWMLLLGAGLVLASVEKPFGSDKAAKVFEAVGTAVLAGGVFEAILKSLKYLDLFKEQLTDIIYEPKFLSIRNDVVDVWKNVSKILYLSKFPEISNRIEEKILDEYFPTNVNYYYDTFIQNITIKFHDEAKKYISVTEILDFNVKPIDNSQKIVLNYGSIINKTSSDTVSNFELLEAFSNSVDKKAEANATVDKSHLDGKALKIKFSLNLEGENAYHVKIKFNKIYDLDEDNSKVFTAKRFINNAELHISYSPDLNVAFYSMGTPTDFTSKGGSDTLIWKEYKDLLFPHQGYRLVLRRR